jgi:hypothetical protein
MKTVALVAGLLAFSSTALAGDFEALVADRMAVERVYHEHRTGTKRPFEEAMPFDLVERLVRTDLKKQFALKRSYRVEITDALVEAEIARINTTTRAPEILAEIKAALGNDAARFARSMARPIVVERELRRRFENDDALHAPQRRASERVREATRAAAKNGVEAQIGALRANKAGSFSEFTWQLTPRQESETGNQSRAERDGLPKEARRDAAEAASKPETGALPQTKAVARSGAYSIEATAQIAQTLTPPAEARDRKLYFHDLDPELQNVLRAQLQKAGDVSAVIETPGAFLLFIAKEKSATTLNACSLSIPKRSYEEWLAQQPDESP